MQWCRDNLETATYQQLSIMLPEPQVVQVLFDEFSKAVRSLESHLKKTRQADARENRRNNPYQIFRDCTRDMPENVDTLIQQVQVPIESVHPDDSSVVAPQPVRLLPDLPVVCKGLPREVIYHERDQIWVDNLSSLEPGDVGVQEKIVASDHAILEEFGRVWSDRWTKMTHVSRNQWVDIMDFCSQHMPPVDWTFQPWSNCKLKQFDLTKETSLLRWVWMVSVAKTCSLCRPLGCLKIVRLYEAVEQGGAWPQQLLQGCVSSLHKNKGDGGVDSYRPITIYPLVMRIYEAHTELEKHCKLLPVCCRLASKGASPIENPLPFGLRCRKCWSWLT